MPYLKGQTSERATNCIFCYKVSHKDDAAEHVLMRGQQCFVTLNLYPYNNGHLMIVPNQHIGSLEALAEETMTEMMILSQQAIEVLKQAYNPQGFNIGINQGAAAGAGIAAHLHQHIVPRWAGDTNFMMSIGQTRVIPEWIDETYSHLLKIWGELFSPPNR